MPWLVTPPLSLTNLNHSHFFWFEPACTNLYMCRREPLMLVRPIVYFPLSSRNIAEMLSIAICPVSSLSFIDWCLIWCWFTVVWATWPHLRVWSSALSTPLCYLWQGDHSLLQPHNPLSCQQHQVPTTVRSTLTTLTIMNSSVIHKTHLITPKVINTFGGRWITLN